MPRLVALRHVDCEDLGSFARYFAARNFSIEYVDVWRDAGIASALTRADMLVVLGGPIGACEEDNYPFLRRELAAIQSWLVTDKPVLGICLGAQLIARALGARVYPGPAVEIGWSPLTLTEEGRNSPLHHLDGAHTSMLHWHGDTFDLPTGAVRLASTAACANQAFSWGAHCLAFQCHPEADPVGLDAWLVAHACELAKHRISISGLRRQNTQFAPLLVRQGLRCLDEWLDGQESVLKAIARDSW